MTEPKWLDIQTVLEVHADQLAENGGLPGVRDPGQLESALARPLNLVVYGAPTLFELAAAYAYGIARTHPFSDGNKRTAFIAAHIFLYINGWKLSAPPADATATFVALAAGTLGEAELAAWLERGCERLP